MKFPKQIHVTIEQDNDDEYLLAYKDGVAEIEDERPVAIYELVKVGRVNIAKTFVEGASK